MAEMRPAVEMKDSGIEWVGQIPRDWKVVPIRSCFDEVIEKNKDGLVKNALKFTYGEIVPKTNFNAEEDDYVADTILNYYVVYPGTIMINGLNLNFDFITQRTGLVKEKGIITSAYVGIAPKDSFVTLPEFMNYLFKAYDYRMAFHNMGGGVRKILNYTRLKSQMVCFPDLAEQQAITDYLDDRCSKIDEIIAEATASIEEYKELKQAVIFEAVTKELDKNVPMKDSGIEWLPYVPEHWDVRRIATIYDESKETGRDDLPILLVSIHTGISDREIDNEERDRKVIRSEDKTIYKVVHKNYLAYNMMRAWQGGFGAAAIDGLVSPAYVVAKPKIEVNSAYIENVLRTPNAIEHIRGMSYGVADFRLRLYWPYFKNIRVPFPSIEEQNRIVEYIKNHALKFDSLISEKQSLISDLQAYKKSLIYEVVTGKRRVV